MVAHENQQKLGWSDGADSADDIAAPEPHWPLKFKEELNETVDFDKRIWDCSAESVDDFCIINGHEGSGTWPSSR